MRNLEKDIGYDTQILNLEPAAAKAKLTEFLQVYRPNLLRCIQKYMNRRINVRFDAEDVLQDAALEVCKRIENGKVSCKGNLFQFVLAVAMHVLLGKIEYEKAKKRSYEHTVSADDIPERIHVRKSTQDTIDDVYALCDEHARAASPNLVVAARPVVDLLRLGFTKIEVAKVLGTHERVIRRRITELRALHRARSLNT